MASRWFSMRVLLIAGDLIALGVLGLSLARLPFIAAILQPGSLSDLIVPEGFEATVYAADLEGPRFLAFGPDRRLYVAESGANRILALSDTDGNGRSDRREVFAADVASPHSVVWQEGALYVGVPTGVVELRDRDGDGVAEGRRVLLDDYPTEGHSTRTVLFLQDGRMLVSVGSSCNVCEEDDERRATIVAYDGPSAGGEKLFATGLRNAVGLALHPRSGRLWVTNNGRDWMGDDEPPETLYVVGEGDDVGWPRCHAGDIVDPDYGDENGCRGVAEPALRMQAHSAPLGLAFQTGGAFPARWRDDLFVAFHGSWNRSVPTGFKVVRVPMDKDEQAGAPEDFVTGFREPETGNPRGRPVGLVFGPDGALYVSDDKGGFVYRVAYVGTSRDEE